MSRLLALAALALLAAPAGVQAQASPSPYTSATRYDGAGRVTGTISPDPDGVGSGNPFLAVRNSYDSAGRLLTVESGTLSAWQSHDVAPSSWTGFTVERTVETRYDAMGRKLREWVREDAAGTVRTMTEHSYDAIGRLQCTAVRMNPAVFAFSGTPNACQPNAPGTDVNDFGPDRIAKNVYDAAGQRVQLRVGVGAGSDIEAAEATWAYNLNGQVTTVIDANGNRAGLIYDGHMRQSCWMLPATTRPSNYIDTNQTTALASAGNLSGTIVDGQCASGDYEAYSYDANGNRLTHRKRDGSTLAFQYDNLNRLLVKVVPERSGLDSSHTRDVYYAYDLRNLQTHARFDSHTGPGIVNAYDGFGRLVATTNSLLGSTARTLTYAYDRNGNRTRITHPDGQWFEYEHDGLNRFTGIDENGSSDIAGLSYYPGGEPYILGRGWAAVGWLYDDVGRMRYQIADLPNGHGSSWTFTRNPASGLSTVTRSNDDYAWTGHYAVNRAYTTDGLNRYSAAGGATFTYDLNGNLTSDGSNTYTYDVENRLVGASGGVQLAYDPLGRLASTTGSPNLTRFLWDGDALVLEYNSSNAITARYVHGPAAGADDPIFWYDGAAVNADTRRQLYADERGSIVAVTDAVGNRLNVNRFDEYGIPASANASRFQYTGQIWLPELGMYHYKARIYSPFIGRMLQTDPVGYVDQINLYAYVSNDPVNAADPSGQQTCVGTPVQCQAYFDALKLASAAAASRSVTGRDRSDLSRIINGMRSDRYYLIRFDTKDHIDRVTRNRGYAYTEIDTNERVIQTVLPNDFAELFEYYGENYAAAARAGAVIHEGSHREDFRNGSLRREDRFVRSSPTERKADRMQDVVTNEARRVCESVTRETAGATCR